MNQSRFGRLYMWSIVVFGSVITLLSISQLPFEQLDLRFLLLALLGEDEAFQEASLWIARRCLEEYLDLVERGRELSLSVELLRLAQIVRGRGNDMESERCGDRYGEADQEAVQHRVIIH